MTIPKVTVRWTVHHIALGQDEYGSDAKRWTTALEGELVSFVAVGDTVKAIVLVDDVFHTPDLDDVTVVRSAP